MTSWFIILVKLIWFILRNGEDGALNNSQSH